MKLSKAVLSTFLGLAASGIMADPYTPIAAPSQVQTHLRVDIKEDTKEIKFVNTNNDPWIFTKVYQMKSADPYEMRPYVRSAVQSYRVTPANPNHIDNGTASFVAGPGAAKVEAIKYMDGTGFLIVSAEEFRFGKQPNGAMGIDELIEKLDQKDMSSSSGHKNYLYFPKYIDATSLRNILVNVGASVNPNDQYELDQGKDRLRADPDLNAIFLYTPAYSVKVIEDLLKVYDVPTAEARIKYTIYELNYENDGEIGADFQSWKNGPGSDLFAIGGRWTNGWDPANMQPATRSYTGSSHAEYVNFSPKWNTKYLDFLVSKSKANIITSGTINLMNNTEGAVSNTMRIPAIQDGSQIASNVTLNQYIRLTNVGWDNGTSLPATSATPYTASQYNRYRIKDAVNENGNEIKILNGNGDAVNATINFVITKTTVGSETYYYMELDPNADAFFYCQTEFAQNIGKYAKAYNVKLQRATSVTPPAGGTTLYTIDWVDQTSWVTDREFKMLKNVQRNSAINSYGFNLTLKPVVCGKASTVDVYMSNTNLIGFKNTGIPRTSKSEVSTKIALDNSGKQFVIGGLEKEEIVRGTSKVPYLGDIPGLGWLLGTEGEVSKKSKLVAVLESVPVKPDTGLTPEASASIKEIREKIDNYGIKAGFIDQNDYGFDQFLFDADKDKEGFAPLP